MRLKDKVAIITGGGRGIGRAYAIRFAQEGAKVVVADNILENAQKVVKEIEANKGTALAVYTDVSNESSTEEMAKATVNQFGSIDILLNNAAVFFGLRRASWDKWSLEEWNKIWNVNVLGIWFCAKAAVPYMINQQKGKIINISSVAALLGPPNLLPYNCSKAAVIAITHSLARELGAYNINVNGIIPGTTQTEAVKETYKNDLNVYMQRMEESRNMRALKRDEMPEDMVGTAVFLASEDSAFVTGQMITVDGGGTFRF